MLSDIQINKAVAIKVMGWIYDSNYGVHTHAGFDKLFGGYKDKQGNYVNTGCWSPTTNVVDSRTLIKRLMFLNCKVRIEISPNGCEVNINRIERPYQMYTVKDKSPNRAICLSSLKVMEDINERSF